MNEMDTLRELFTTKFDALNQRFDGQDLILQEIKQQTTKTNGRVNTLEKLVAAIVERIESILHRLVGHDREIRDLKRTGRAAAASPEVAAGENRGITQRDVFIVLGTLGAGWAVMQAIGLIRDVAR